MRREAPTGYLLVKGSYPKKLAPTGPVLGDPFIKKRHMS